MKWISVKERLPKISGKYIVHTVGTSKLYQTKNRFETRFIPNEEKGGGTFDVNNQVVEFWLEE